MSGRVLLVEGSGVHDIFEVVELTDTAARVRSPFLFEIGEELKVKVELVPVTSAIEVCRGLMIGRLTSMHAIQVAYLIISTLVMSEFAIRSFRRRLAT